MEELIVLLEAKESLLPGWRIRYSDVYDSFYVYCNWEELPSRKISSWEMISKSYWFVKYLLNKDKINLDKISDEYEEIRDSNFSWIDIVTMILSIQDDPIKYLISILK